MSTTFPLGPPPAIAASERISLKHNYNFQKSPYSGAVSATTQGYTEWSFEIGYPPMSYAKAQTFMAWVDSLRGQYGTFTYQPRKSGLAVTGKTLFSTAFATTTDIIVSGWAGTQSSGLVVGAFLSFGGQFFRITAAPLNSTLGKCTISIEPPVRVNIAAATPIEFATPTITLRMEGGENGQAAGVSHDPEASYVDAISAVEAR